MKLRLVYVIACLCAAAVPLAHAADKAPAAPAAPPPAPTEPKPYTETIPGTKITFDMVYLPGGKFLMGSPAKDKARGKDEGPQHEVSVKPFWMSKNEVSWDEYAVYTAEGTKKLLAGDDIEGGGPDAISYPTPPYADETFGYGKNKQPAIAVTWHAAISYTRWLAHKTKTLYRIPSEAEWEYACRAGTDTAYSFGDNPKTLGDFAWFAGNSGKKPHAIGGKKPNPFGLNDMHGNVAEWTIDQYDAGAYAKAKADELPVVLPGNRRFPHVARGGGWNDKPALLRCAARRLSEKWWSKQDPQNPQSIWWHTEATNVGFRLLRPVDEYPALKGLKSQMKPESPY